VSGVGPKLAIKMLSGLSSEQTVQAIRSQDHAQLTRIPGVGKKLADGWWSSSKINSTTLPLRLWRRR